MITGHPDLDAVDALQFGESVVGVIAKPYRVTEIRELLASLLTCPELEVGAATNGHEALEMVCHWPTDKFGA